MRPRDRLDDHFAEWLLPLVENSDHGLYARGDGIVVTAVGRGGDVFNTAAAFDVPRGAPTAVQWAIDLLASTDCRYAFQVPTDLRSAVGPHLERQGLVLVETLPGMAHDRISSIPAAPLGLRLVTVTDGDRLADHAAAITRGFGGTDPSALAAVLTPALLADPRVTMLNGYLDDDETLVATSASAVVHGIAGVFGVTVAERARRRGLGAAMTWAATAAGVRAGADSAALQASALGSSVYARMGFRTVRTFDRYALGSGAGVPKTTPRA
ncbi:MAG TPA: hypothetical protein VNB94_10660 [Mycobacteriales bacterium]|nr:hypothetical protein [Mycobacteriales bacterium]